MKSRGSGEVYHQTYKDSAGLRREVSTWSAAYYSRHLKKKVRKHGFATSTAAHRWLRAAFAKMEAGLRLDGDGVGMRLSDAYELVTLNYRLKGRRSARVLPRLKRYVIESMGDLKLADLEEHHIDAHAARLLDLGLAPGSVNRTLSMLRHALTLASRRWRGTFFPPHVQLLKEDNIRREFAPWDEVERICAALPPVESAFVRAVAITGWRPWRELASRTWAHVDDAGGLLYLHRGEGKTDVAKACPLDPDLRPIIDAMRAHSHGSPWIFPGPDGGRLKSFHRSKEWKAALVTAGSPKGRILYDLCKSAARDLIRAGIPEHQAQTWVGKKTPSVFRRYDIVDDADLRANADKLKAYRDEERTKAAEASDVVH